jgi:hypothetical protein
VFNSYSSEIRLGVNLDTASAVQAARDGTSLAEIASFFDREDDSGVLHPEQLITALTCIVNMIDNPRQNGIILGAMQSGKTTTSLAMQFAGPIIYTVTGRRPYPLYLATSHTGQQDQTNIELTHFLDYYGQVRIVKSRDRDGGAVPQVDPFFMMSPTIKFYRSRVLRNALGDVHIGPRLEDFVTRRVQGQSIQRIADVCRRAHEHGFEPLLLIDEPQYGASDRIVVNEEGLEERRPCVLLQIFQSIDEALADRAAQSFIGLSATPYDTHELQSVWVIRQKLTTAYRGFNYFGGRYISDGVEVSPPDTLGFSDLATRLNIPFFSNISLSAYDAPPERFNRFARRIGFQGTQLQYQAEVQQAVRAAVVAMAVQAKAPIGICLRLFNNNERARDFVNQLNLGAENIEVLNYFGSEYTNISVKRAIRDRQHRNRHFVIVVTNRARMGDAFPAHVRWFLDFANRASDLNALLQGLLGRACGYNKSSTVVLSDDNAQIVDDYKRSLGGYIYPTSRHSIVVGGYRRGAPSGLIRLRSDMDDPLIRQFFDRIQGEIVDKVVMKNRPRLTTTRNRGGFRTGPILTIAQEMDLFNYLEHDDTVVRLFPTIAGGLKIARPADAVRHSRDRERFLRYTLTKSGECRFTFRWSNGSGAHVGVSSRGYGARDATDRARAADNLEPQIHLEKYHPATGEVIFDKDQAVLRPGNWRAYMVTLPLLEPVRELQPGATSLPNERSVHRGLMTPEEEELAGFTD